MKDKSNLKKHQTTLHNFFDLTKDEEPNAPNPKRTITKGVITYSEVIDLCSSDSEGELIVDMRKGQSTHTQTQSQIQNVTSKSEVNLLHSVAIKKEKEEDDSNIIYTLL